MKRSVILTLTLWCVICVSADDAAAATPDPRNYIIDAGNKFSTKLFTDFASRQIESNLIMSPLSAWLALSMTAYGAGGQTFEKLKKSLMLPNDSSIAFDGFTQLINELNNAKDLDLALANRLYVADDLKLEPKFESIAENVFHAAAKPFDKSNPEKAAEDINKWVSDATREKIKDLVDKSEIKSTLRLLLLNAVYFKGEWKFKFNSSNTLNKSFHAGINIGVREKSVPTMSITDNFFWGDLEDLGAKFIQLPYKNEDAQMTIIVPYGHTNLRKIMNHLNYFNASRLAESGFESKVQLSLPKFKINTTINLYHHLRRLGMSEMFSATQANFTNMSKEPLQINKVRQKAFIEVNEEGSEAAAVTEVQVGFKSGIDGVTAFNVNRPSLFLITVKNITIFMGRIADPEY